MKITNRRLSSLLAAPVLALALAGLSPTPVEASGRDAVRSVIAERGEAVIKVEVVHDIKSSYGGQQYDQERRSEVNGFIIGEEGLLVTALSSVDPGQFYASLSDGEDSFVTTIKSAKYIMADNSEIDAAVVLRDSDRDLVFFRPMEEQEDPFTYIPLEESGHPEILDEAFTIVRMGRIARRTVIGMSGEIQGVITRPRAYYIPHGELSTGGAGTPIFNASGECIGMGGMYIFPGGRSAIGDQDEPVMFIVVPTADIIDVADQAREAAPEEMEAAQDAGDGEE